MSEMVDRILEGEVWHILSDYMSSDLMREVVRKVIEGMREPTEAMIEAAYYPAGEAGDDSCSRDTAREAWQAMIDEALRE